jgi:co-chaperonin GroES (HSP10)
MPTTTVRPLGHRVLVQPDPDPVTTTSGFLIPETSAIPKMSGRVIAVGNGPEREARLRARVLRKVLHMADACAGLDDFRSALQRYLAAASVPLRVVQVQDRVLFSDSAGYEVVTGEDRQASVLVLAEDDVLAIVEE